MAVVEGPLAGNHTVTAILGSPGGGGTALAEGPSILIVEGF